MKCPNCGIDLGPNDSKFKCPNCRAEVTSTVLSMTDRNHTQTPETDAAEFEEHTACHESEGRMVVTAEFARSLESRLQQSPGEPCAGLFAPSRLPARDARGFFWHPDMNIVAFDESIEWDTSKGIAKLLGFELANIYLDYDVDDEAEYDVNTWKPEAPSGEGWNLVAVADSEDGPVAYFVRALAALSRLSLATTAPTGLTEEWYTLKELFDFCMDRGDIGHQGLGLTRVENIERVLRASVERIDPATTATGGELSLEFIEGLLNTLEAYQNEMENQTCSDVCDKTYETRGCLGPCALESGKRSVKEQMEQLELMRDAATPNHPKMEN